MNTPELIRAAREGNRGAENELIRQNSPLIWSIVRRFYGRGEPDDLFQLGAIGLLKAVRGYNFSAGCELSTYAVPKIVGEIRRFLRDDGLIKISRTLKQNAAKVAFAVNALGEEAKVSEISEKCGLSEGEIAECEGIFGISQSLDQGIGEDGFSLHNLLSSGDGEDRELLRLDIKSAISRLPEREKAVVVLRFFKDLTQQKSANILGISQVQVSRAEKKAVELLKVMLE